MSPEELVGQAAAIAMREVGAGYSVRFWFGKDPQAPGGLWFGVATVGATMADHGPVTEGHLPLSNGGIDEAAFIKMLRTCIQTADTSARVETYLRHSDEIGRTKYRRHLVNLIAEKAGVAPPEVRRWLKQAMKQGARK